MAQATAPLLDSTGKLTGNFSESGLVRRFSRPLGQQIQIPCGAIPCATEQGIVGGHNREFSQRNREFSSTEQRFSDYANAAIESYRSYRHNENLDRREPIKAAMVATRKIGPQDGYVRPIVDLIIHGRSLRSYSTTAIIGPYPPWPGASLRPSAGA